MKPRGNALYGSYTFRQRPEPPSGANMVSLRTRGCPDLTIWKQFLSITLMVEERGWT